MRHKNPSSKGPRTPNRGDGARNDAKRGDFKRGNFKGGDAKRNDAKRGDAKRSDFKRGDAKPARADDKNRKFTPKDRPGSKPYAKPFAKSFSKTSYGRSPKPDSAAAPVARTHAPRVREQASPRLTGPLLWGFHAVRSAWLNKDRRIVRLMVTDAGLAGFQETLDAATLKRPQPEVLDKLLFDRLMPPGAVHQGIAALVESLPVRDAHDLIASLSPNEKAVIVVLDQVTDPHNVGAILRSASAFGAKGVIMQDRHAPELTGVLAKTASGAVDVMPVAVETNLSRAIELLQENGFKVVGLDERGDPLADFTAPDRVALVLGAEGTGIRQNVANHCDTLVSLPTEGTILSLNVSNAAAVALYAFKK